MIGSGLRAAIGGRTGNLLAAKSADRSPLSCMPVVSSASVGDLRFGLVQYLGFGGSDLGEKSFSKSIVH